MNPLAALQGVFQSPATAAAASGFVASFALYVLLVITKRWHGALIMNFTNGIQKFNAAPIPRDAQCQQFRARVYGSFQINVRSQRSKRFARNLKAMRLP
jgi:hypothetical protein